eukprot:g549.t1
MVVSWTTNVSDADTTVTYGVSPALSNASISAGSTKTYTEGGWIGFLHTATLRGLTEATVYYYRISGREDEIFSFRSSPGTLRRPLSFIAYGDMGAPGDRNGPGANETAAFCARRANETDFVLHVGDIPYDKGDEFVWDSFFNGVESYASKIPYMTCPGNEDHAYDFVGYLKRFRMPGSTDTNCSWFYSFDYSHVHVVSISTEYISREPGSDQYAFLESDLRAVNRSVTPFVVMIGHRPLYCSSNDYYDCNMWGPRARESLEPLLSRYGVDLYICGHVHSYERTFPVLNGTRVANGTIHVMVGGAGAGLSHAWSHERPAWSASRVIDYAVGVVDIPDARTLTWKLMSTTRDDGEALDAFTIHRDDP